MGKIYDGENKLNVAQVCEKLGKEINAEQAKIMADRLSTNENPKVRFAHMVLDAYRYLPSTTEQDMLVKKYAKHLMEKYMKSSAVMDGEDKAFQSLIETIVAKVTQSEIE